MKTAALPAGTSRLGSWCGTSRQQSALHGQNYNLAVPTAQPSPKGNRCDHNKNDPKFYPAHINIEKFPKIIQRTHNLLELAYYDPRKLWKSLNFLKNKKKRSERREGFIIVAQYLNTHNNLKDFTVKSPARDIAYYTGLSLSRVKQALKDLITAGYIKTTSFIKHRFKGAWYGITAIRQLTDKFYLELGISEHALHSARCWKSGNKMIDTRASKKPGSTMKKVSEFIGNVKNTVYSAVNSKPFYTSKEPIITSQSTNELMQSQTIQEEIANDLIIRAKAESTETKEPWFKIYRRLEKEYREQNSPPST